MTTTTRPAWWPTAEQKVHADAGCAHPDHCRVTGAATVVQVLDDSRQHNLPTGYVTVTAPAGATDAELADAAGYGTSHYGHTVTRHDDGTATVALWND